MSDLISRQDAIEQIQAWAVDLNHPNHLIRDDAVYILEALPSADRPRGKDCNGCKFVGSYDTEFPCANCERKTKDYYCGAYMKGADHEADNG